MKWPTLERACEFGSVGVARLLLMTVVCTAYHFLGALGLLSTVLLWTCCDLTKKIHGGLFKHDRGRVLQRKPGYESASWLNKIVETAWPGVDRVFKDKLANSLEVTLKKALHEQNIRFRFRSASLGSEPVSIEWIKVERDPQDSVLTIDLSLRVGGTVRLKVEMSPLKVGQVDVVNFSLLKAPTVDFRFHGLLLTANELTLDRMYAGKYCYLNATYWRVPLGICDLKLVSNVRVAVQQARDTNNWNVRGKIDSLDLDFKATGIVAFLNISVFSEPLRWILQWIAINYTFKQSLVEPRFQPNINKDLLSKIRNIPKTIFLLLKIALAAILFVKFIVASIKEAVEKIRQLLADIAVTCSMSFKQMLQVVVMSLDEGSEMVVKIILAIVGGPGDWPAPSAAETALILADADEKKKMDTIQVMNTIQVKDKVQERKKTTLFDLFSLFLRDEVKEKQTLELLN